MSKKSYTQRTLDALRDQGCEVDIVERFIAQAGKAIPVKGSPHLRRRTGIRKDLFGIIDLIALRPPYCTIPNFHKNCEPPWDAQNTKFLKRWELVGIQCFGQDFAAHKRKVLARKYAPIWLASGNAIELWGWRKLKVGKAEVWKPRVYRFQRGEFEITVPPTPQLKYRSEGASRNIQMTKEIFEIEKDLKGLVDSL